MSRCCIGGKALGVSRLGYGVRLDTECGWVLVAGCWRCGAESRVLGVGGMVLSLGAVVWVRRWV